MEDHEWGSLVQFETLKQLWMHGVAAVSGQGSVARALQDDGPFSAGLVIAVGKAACSMYQGAASCLTAESRSLIITKHHHVDPVCQSAAGAEIIEAGHPIPDKYSLLAGQRVYDAVSQAGGNERMLLLVSGGASALVELLQPGVSLAGAQAVTQELLGSGQPIGEVNRVRSQLSRIKGGKLLAHFKGRAARVYVLSDVQGDSLATIGGGIGDPARASAAVQARVVASNAVARNAVVAEAARMGIDVRLNEESLYRDVIAVAGEIANCLTGAAPGLYIWGGEPTVELPPDPGMGGRNQSLALAIALRINGKQGISVLVAGTDGTDGPTEYAGACIDGATVDDMAQAEEALQAANAGAYLRRRMALFKTGPTDTNVMDLVIAQVD